MCWGHSHIEEGHAFPVQQANQPAFQVAPTQAPPTGPIAENPAAKGKGRLVIESAAKEWDDAVVVAGLEQGLDGGPAVRVRIRQPDRSWIEHPGRLRSLWKTGAGILHSCFVYPGTKCIVSLTSIDHETVLMNGAVLRSDHITGVSYGLLVHFDYSIEVADFVRRSAAVAASNGESPVSSPMLRLYGLIADHAREVQALTLDRVPLEVVADRIQQMQALCQQGISLNESGEL